MGDASGIDLNKAVETLAGWIIEATHVVVFTGAGLSTASGLPDYRGADGVWTRRDKGLPPPAYTKPEHLMGPNEDHAAIVELEKMGKLDYLISQNVDGFHLDSGFPPDKIAELHGNKNIFKCIECDARFFMEEIGWDKRRHGNGYRTDAPVDGQPRCTGCGGRVISSIVNFSDPLPERELAGAVMHSKKLCDLFIVLGSSLVVTPASRMPLLAKKNGAWLVINNLGETPCDEIADLMVPSDINAFFPPVVELVKKMLA